MNRLLFATALLFASATQAQNLLSNPSFEELSGCPEYYGQFGLVTDWFTCDIGNPDIYNPCAINPELGVPNNVFGYQVPADGDGYMGMITWSAATNPGQGTHEIIGTRLIAPLIAGQTYWISMKVSWTTGSPNISGLTGYASNNIGVKCAMDSLYSAAYWVPWANHAPFFSSSIITDSVGWTLIAGSFVADSAYRYAYLGNFFDDVSTTVQQIDPDGDYGAYYYVDDVCLSPTPGTCPMSVGYQENEMNIPLITSYNGASGTLTLAGIAFRDPVRVELFDYGGRQLGTYEASATEDRVVLKIGNKLQGMFVLRVWDGSAARTQKLLILHQ